MTYDCDKMLKVATEIRGIAKSFGDKEVKIVEFKNKMEGLRPYFKGEVADSIYLLASSIDSLGASEIDAFLNSISVHLENSVAAAKETDRRIAELARTMLGI